jgi:hypothetical protein
MSLYRIFQNRHWIIGRRIAMVLLIVFLGYRSYGPYISSRLQRANGERDVVLTRYEFRPELPNAKPAWIIGFRNASGRFTYDSIELEAIYMDESGKVLEKDKLVVRQKLVPGDEQLIASTDIKDRPGATTGTLKVLGAENISK